MSQLKYETIPKRQSLFNVKKEFFYDVIVPWHVHVEYELVFINMAAGSMHIGSSFDGIEGTEVLMIGPYLPHNWQDARISSGGVLITAIRSASISMRMSSVRGSSTSLRSIP